jgi:hypothetical protein
MFGLIRGSTSEPAEDDLFTKYSIDFDKKYGEGGYGATFAASDTATQEARTAASMADSTQRAASGDQGAAGFSRTQLKKTYRAPCACLRRTHGPRRSAARVMTLCH